MTSANPSQARHHLVDILLDVAGLRATHEPRARESAEHLLHGALASTSDAADDAPQTIAQLLTRLSFAPESDAPLAQRLVESLSFMARANAYDHLISGAPASSVAALSAESRVGIISRIRKLVDHQRYRSGLLAGADGPLAERQLVVVGASRDLDPEHGIGYCVQVRLGRGQFGSDMVFLRHPDDRLVTHENQGFWGMTPAQEALARPLFATQPEDEDCSHGYKCCGGVHEKGFLVQDSASSASPDTAFGFTVTIRKTP